MKVRDLLCGKGAAVATIPEATVHDTMAALVNLRIGSLVVTNTEGRIRERVPNHEQYLLESIKNETIRRVFAEWSRGAASQLCTSALERIHLRLV